MSLVRKVFMKGGSRQSSRKDQADAGIGSSGETKTSTQTSKQTGSQPISGLFDVRDKETTKAASVVIVAVHGLGGNWLKTWESETDEWNWVQSSIGPRLREETGIDARVLSFGYNSNIFATQSVNDIQQVAEALIEGIYNAVRKMDNNSPTVVFIAHSLGGLVVKKAINIAWNNNDRYGKLLSGIRGCLFLGVPHRGANLASWAKIPVRSFQALTGGSLGNDKFVNSLGRNSAVWVDISRDFVQRAKNMQIRTFHETEKFMNQIIVDRDSAVMNLPNEVVLPLGSSDHRTICKFSRTEEERYLPVWDALVELVSSGDSSGEPRDVDPPMNSEMLELFQALGRFDYEAHKNRIAPAYPGTCQWFLTHEQYHAWRTSEQSCLLWLSSDPGCGKSVLMRHLADTLQPEKVGCVCYFFFKSDGDLEQRGLSNAFSAILHQLFGVLPSWIKNLKDDHKRHGALLATMGSKLLRFFTEMAAVEVDCKTEIICLLDAVDECQELEQTELLSQLLKMISEVSDRLGGNFPIMKVLVSSRPYAKIERRLRPLLQRTNGYHIDGNANSGKISDELKAFTTAQITEIGQEIGLSEYVQTVLIERLTTSPEQTYLWITLVLAEIRQMPGKLEKKALAVIKNLPHSLTEAYEKILGRVADKSQARQVLSLILAAERPLTLSEIDVALEVNENVSRFSDLDLEGIAAREEFLRQVSGLFVTVHDGRVYFIHETAREFLLRTERSSKGIAGPELEWGFSFSVIEAHKQLVDICARYLQFQEFAKEPLIIELADSAMTIDYHHTSCRGISWDSNHKWSGIPMAELFEQHAKVAAPGSATTVEPKDALRDHTRRYAFLAYAAEYWLIHVYRTDNQHGRVSFMPLLDAENPCFKNWFSVYWGNGPCTAYSHFGIVQICMAFNLHALLENILVQKTDLEVLDNHGRTALHFAAQHNLVTNTKLLMAAGANLNVEDHTLRTPLHEAVVYGHVNVVQVLLEAGAEPNLRDYAGMAPLHLVRERLDIAKLLVSFGAKVNQKDKYGRLPIALALYEPHWGEHTDEEKAAKYLELIEYFMAKGTNVRSALTRAHFEGLKEAILIIARHVGKPDLITAIELGWEEDFVMLLQKGEDPNLGYLDGTTPLHCAASNGKKGQCDLLLEHGANLDARCCYGRTPLFSAIESKDFETVKFLIDKGADIAVKDLYDMNLLLHSGLRGDLTSFSFFLDQGFDPNSRARDGLDPIRVCLLRGDAQWTKALMAYHPDVSTSYMGCTPIVAACELGPIENVELLLENGASIIDRDASGRTLLTLALWGGQFAIAKFLLEVGHDDEILKNGQKASDLLDEIDRGKDTNRNQVRDLLFM